MNKAVASIDLDAYRRNLARIRSRVSPAEVMAVVKADAYGHGLIPIARAAVEAGIRWFGSLDIPTGLALRSATRAEDIHIFAWLLAPDDDFSSAVSASIDLGVSTIDQLERIADVAVSRRARVHLKIDTGLHRNGASIEEWPSLVSRAVSLASRIELVGVWTHISEASESDDTDAIGLFEHAIAVASDLGATFAVRHLAASAASNDRADSRFDVVRVGAFTYGIAPGGGVTADSLQLEPVMTLRAPVAAVVGSRAQVSIGFGDGIPSSAAGRMSIAINGRRHEITEVSLDSLTIEVDQPVDVAIGDTAVLFGSGGAGEPTLQEWGDTLETIGEEIVTRLNPLIERDHPSPSSETATRL